MRTSLKKLNFKNKRLQTGVTAIQRLHKSHITVTQLFVTAKKRLQNDCNGQKTVTKRL